MLRKILTICISAGLVLVALVVFVPSVAERVTSSVVKGIAAVESGRVTLISKQPVLKIVDPAVVADVIEQKTPSQIKAFFQKAPPESGELVIADIIDATNRERINAGLQPLKVNALLTKSAKIKTEDMINNQYFEHTSPDGVTVSDLGTRVGYEYVIIGENLALGNFTDANDLVQAWMDSPGHRANILNTQYQDIGIYAAKGTFEGRDVWFAVQHFGAGRTACPDIDKTLKVKIDTINANLSDEQVAIERLKGKLQEAKPDTSEYMDMLKRFNSMVNEYNSELSESRGFIAQYNEQVRAFNACLAKYQK